MKVEFFRHAIDETDRTSVDQALRAIILTTGDLVYELENSLESYLGIPHVVGVTSCTAALHLALEAWDIGEGDEVITTPMSFCATSNAIIQSGAKPIFVDVEDSTGNIDAHLVEAAVTERTRAILPVHLYGQLCDMKELRRIADERGLIIIEDAAHCLEGSREGIRVGELSEATCFSFYATKSITSGEGGAIAVHDEGKSKYLKLLRLHGMDRTASERHNEAYRHWDMPVLGYKYNMDNIQASLLLGQLKRVDQIWKSRRQVYDHYREALQSVDQIKLVECLPKTQHGAHLFVIRVPGERRDEFLKGLNERGIGVSVNYRSIHLLTYYKDAFGFKRGDFPISEKFGDEVIALPLHTHLTKQELDYVVEAVKQVAYGL